MRHKRGYYDVLVRTCAKFPSNVAVRQYVNGDYKKYTYSELYGACEYISQNLQQLHCKTGVIGLISDRNVLIPCVIAAAHKYSTSFMFLDPSHGIDKVFTKIKFRILIIIQNDDGSLKSLYTNKKPDRTITFFNLRINFYNYAPPDSLPHVKHVNECSFIAMTSGSTGEPKHIQVPTQCLQPNIDDLTKLFKITANDVIYFSTPLTFDPSMIEILIACHNGASLLIAPERASVLFPANKQNSVSFWQTTPSRFLQLSNSEIKNIILSENSSLKVLALGGEPLNGVKRLRELKDLGNQTRIFTLYGVTEMSCWACVAELDLNKIKSDREVPLGSCLSETQLIIEPSANKESNQGKIILVSKTRKCIILDKTNKKDETSSLKFIDTGDLAEVREGTVYYVGRTDDIVKRFGHKVNLQSIESAVMQCTRVKTCSCVWIPKPMLLVVYFSSECLTSQELSNYLKCKLDDKHWPDKIIRVDNLPTNLHGKISKQIITQMHENNSEPQSINNCKFNLIREINNTLNTQFCYDEIKNKDFFAIGGTSFLAISMCNKISQDNPYFGRLILPHLLSQQNSIKKVVELAEKEMCTDEVKGKRRTKRTRSNTASPNNSTFYKKANASPSRSAEFIVCWSHDTGKCVDASPTLLLAGLNLYVVVGSHSGKIIVVDTITGQLRGEIALASRIEAPVQCCQLPGSPVCGVVGTYDGTVVCFTLQECKILWEINIGSMVKSKAVCCNAILYVASYDGNISCIDFMTGDIKEVIHIADQAISADLVLAKNKYILLGTLSGVCASVHAGSLDRSVAWRGTLGSSVFASPVLYNNDKYVIFAEVNGEIHCRTVVKGIEIWKFQGAKGNIFSSIYVKKTDNFKWQMVFGCHDSKVYSIIIKNFQPSLLWTTQLASPVYATPTALSDKLILAVANNGKLHAIDSEKGVVLTEYQLPGETFSSPAVYGEYIFIGCRNDHLYCLRFVSNL